MQPGYPMYNPQGAQPMRTGYPQVMAMPQQQGMYMARPGMVPMTQPGRTMQYQPGIPGQVQPMGMMAPQHQQQQMIQQPFPQGAQQQQQQQQQGPDPSVLERMKEPHQTWKTSAERDFNETLGEIFAIMRTIEYLEKAFASDRIAYRDYSDMCAKLLSQLRVSHSSVQSKLPDLARFCSDFNLSCPLALQRVKAGKPAPPPETDGNMARAVAELTGVAITCKNVLEMTVRKVTALHPYLLNLMAALDRCRPLFSATFVFPNKIKEWCNILEQKGPSAELTEDEVTRLKYDIDCGLTEFNSQL